MNGDNETKSEIRARLEELHEFVKHIDAAMTRDHNAGHRENPEFILLRAQTYDRIRLFKEKLETAQEDLSTSILASHKALCKVKNMDEKAAYGNDPAVYYTLGVCGEAGEMANAIVKSLRNGTVREKILAAVVSELPDVVIYSYVLAHTLDIDLSKLVNEKAQIVVQRALDGYYGGPLEP